MSSPNRRGSIPTSEMPPEPSQAPGNEVQPSEESAAEPLVQSKALSPVAKQFMSEKQKFEKMKMDLSKKKGPIHVIATKPGFYKGKRRSVKDQFTIDSVEDLGMWMKPI